ncbi:hypothetical protein [Gordonia alkanivorans]|uniref:hypothetical protein n=2 Tax=Gordonia alkanivorans TaxID=84096 RepID=UPI0024493A9F|nr:hypothetical protein [Gordonia alkanivorans]MDH3007153.1 hypothetical protein [Gordonia alkanivorans]MDH3013652.1 hypothetical protein [Gordonia alkanivorans]MDH3017044.1 hypothetical protein [Gordonia alkanivorans]MDH3042209.1 hypothetical protein [Gordonia alkanivorans]
MSLGTVVPIAVASTNVTAVVESLIDREIVREATQHDNTSDIFTDLPDSTIMVVTPGTNDTTLIPRNLPYVGHRQTLIVNYPESFGPVIAGRSNTLAPFAPGYDESKEHAMNQNLAVMAAFVDMGEDRPFVVYTGFSQGADALGDAAEDPRAYDNDFLVPGKDMVVLVADPRSPWGIKAWLDTMPWLKPFVAVAGIDANGARDPEATGKIKIVSVIVVGDPVSNFQWVAYRPVTSLVVNAAGFLTIHSGNGPHTYGDVERLGDPTEYTSGNTTYLVYDAAHPLALLAATVYDTLGIAYDKDDLARWDELAEAYYPTQAPNPDTAAVPVTAADSVKQDQPGDGYTVTVPSEVATGAEKPGGPPETRGIVPAGAVPPAVDDVPTDDRTPTDEREPDRGDAGDRPDSSDKPDSDHSDSDSDSGSGSGSGSGKPDSGDSGAGDSGSSTGGDDSSSSSTGGDRENSESSETGSAGGGSTDHEAA